MKIYYFTKTIALSALLLIIFGFADPFGTYLGTYNGVASYSNGSNGYVSNTYNYVNGTNTGMEWQCVEYVNRYYLINYLMNIRIAGQNAVDYFPNAAARGLVSYTNGGTVAPSIGDVLCFSGNTYGHVAIIREVGTNYLKVAQQNVTNSSGDINYNVVMTISSGHYTVSGSSIGSNYSCQGWLRKLSTGYAKVSQGVSVSPNPIIRGGSLQANFTLLEVNGSSITFDTITCAILNNSNVLQFNLSRYNNVTISSNGSYNYNATGYFSSSLPLGTYKAVARGYKNGTGWFDFTTTGSGQNPLSFQVIDNPTNPDPPVLLSPGTPNTPGPVLSTLTPAMQWQTGNGATRYGLYISIYPYGSGNLVYENENITGSSFTIPSGILNNNSQYRWNMRSFNSSGLTSSYTSPFYFQTPASIPDPPTLVSPNGGIYTQTPTFIWTVGNGAVKYGLYISIYPYGSGNLVYENENITGTSFVIPSGILQQNSQYRWNMRSFNSNGGSSSYTAVMYFNVNPISGINIISSDIPKEFRLFQNYPNPFNSMTIIKYQIKEANQTSIRIYDINGKEVSKLLDDFSLPGSFEILWNSNNLSSGLYFCRIQSGQNMSVRKMTLIK